MRLPVLVLLCALLAGCVQFPEIDDATGPIARDAAYPDLISLDSIADVLNGPGEVPLDTQDQLDARVSGLKSRADRLRAPVLDESERARLAQTPQ
ncbi:hypothetical protein ROLI_012870 [Roseobacter fucihabitans]|uniref:Lipoprotein n=1 Tax=Roseobacter fucihabitans TaxID=1537242 RepID=A0ABZ2BR82_9RHOB|nr:hypothetical protein [Roseobacter litoralis]MBC6964186.1 hypothetical protein [Roseobacter litoralis]